jgi:adenine-specific DNA methylase
MTDEKARENNRLRQRKFLERHKDEVNQKRRDKYHERLDRGKCPRCGGRVKKGRTLCADCCEYMLNLNRKYAKQNKATAKPRAAKAKASVKAKPKAKPAKAKRAPLKKKK